jgi:hypothetical protein
MIPSRVKLAALALALVSSAYAFDWGQSGDSTSFVKNTLLDQPYSVAQEKYKSSLHSDSCSQAQVSGCRKNSWTDCKCFEVNLVREQFKSQVLKGVTHEGKIVEVTDMRIAANQDIPDFYPPLKSYSGSSAPEEVYELKGPSGYQAYLVLWKSKDLMAGANVLCPLPKHGGAMTKATTPLKDCYVPTFQASRVQSMNGNSRKVSVDY